MQKLISILSGIAILYALYALGLKSWDYTSEEKRLQIKQQVRQEGISTRFYFITPRRLLLFTLLSGGLFIFYWAYKQWQAVLSSYKNTAGDTLAFGPMLRSLFSCITFYQLNAIVNRTCVYMHKAPAFPPVVWATALWAGAAAAAIPQLHLAWRITGAVFCVAAPYVLQKHINLLPKKLPPSRIKLMEIVFLGLSWCMWGGFIWMLSQRIQGK